MKKWMSIVLGSVAVLASVTASAHPWGYHHGHHYYHHRGGDYVMVGVGGGAYYRTVPAYPARPVAYYETRPRTVRVVESEYIEDYPPAYRVIEEPRTYVVPETYYSEPSVSLGIRLR